MDNYKYYIIRQDKAPKIPCQCGCGEMISSITRRGYPARFKNGHGHKGQRHYNWNGGKYKHQGYIYIWKPDHPHATKDGYILEHRLVYEEYYKCCLPLFIEIHHINGIKDDNRIENLLPVTRNEHRKQHYSDMSDRICANCKSTEVSLKTNGRPNWKKNRIGEGYWCLRCYMKWYDRNKRKRS